MKVSTLTSLFMLAIPFLAWSQVGKTSLSDTREVGSAWYVGSQVGSLTGKSDFSSFAVDKTRLGWNTGIYGGYHYNTLLSIEAFAQWGKAYLAEQACCSERNYWLNTDTWSRSLLQKGPGAHYNDLLSKNFIQRYGLQFNINLLGIFSPNKLLPLRIECAPHISAIGSSTEIAIKQNGETLRAGINKWHMGLGTNVMVSYAINEHLDLGVYAGATYLTGKNFDAMPEIHSDNYLYDAGLRLTWNFRTNKKAKTSKPMLRPTVVEEQTVVEDKPVVVEEPGCGGRTRGG